MTDREMLQLAAKAAGIKVPTKKDYPYAYIDERGIHRDISCGGDGTRMSHWNPLIDDGDALRLAMKLGLVVDCSRPSASEPWKQHVIWLDELMSNAELTRRAIVRAAAEIGKE